MAGGDFCGLAIVPLFIFIFFVSVISRAMRGTAMGGTYRAGYGSSYGSGHSGYGHNQNRSYGSNQYAYNYLSRPRTSYTPYTPNYSSGYRNPMTTVVVTTPMQPNYGPPTTGYGNAPGYGGPAPGYGAQPQQGYGVPTTGYSPGYQPPMQQVQKVSCTYCGSLNPNTERNCLLCGAPMR